MIRCYIIFLRFFPLIFFWWNIYSSPDIFIYKMFNLLFFQNFFLFLHDLTRLLQRMKNIIFFIDEIHCCFYVFYPIRRINIWPATPETYFITFIIQSLNMIESSESKSSFITSSTSSLVMISIFYHLLNALQDLRHYLWLKKMTYFYKLDHFLLIKAT